MFHLLENRIMTYKITKESSVLSKIIIVSVIAVAPPPPFIED